MSFNEKSFLRKLLRWVISRSTPLIAFGFEMEANDSLADFGCLQTVDGRDNKTVIMDNYKAYKGIVTEKLRVVVGKSMYLSDSQRSVRRHSIQDTG
jgi:hypothetical protein